MGVVERSSSALCIRLFECMLESNDPLCVCNPSYNGKGSL